MRFTFATIIMDDFPSNQHDGEWTAYSLYDNRPFYEQIPFETYVIGAIVLIMIIAVAIGATALIRSRKNPKKHK